MVSVVPLLPLLTAAGILLAGNGLQGTLITLRAAEEGFDPAIVGLMGTSYFAGFMAAAFITPAMLRAVGHIRVFATLAALAASATLVLVLWIDPLAWVIVRAGMGFAFSGLFMTIESWLNASVQNADRARLLSVYRVLDLAVVTGSQFLLPVFGTGGFTLFAIAAIMITMSLAPVSLADRSHPSAPDKTGFDLRQVWSISPLAALGCVTIGLTNSAFRMIGPLYASQTGLNTSGVAVFMAAGIVGGALSQYPLGWLSDRYDRRWVLIMATCAAALSGAAMTFVDAGEENLLYAAAFAFGAASLPLYSLSAAHANDRAGPGQFVLIAAGLSFFYSLGAAVGPSLAAQAMKLSGPSGLFMYTSVIHLALAGLTLWRMAARAPAERGHGRFMALLRTSPVFFRLARKGAERRGGAGRTVDETPPAP